MRRKIKGWPPTVNVGYRGPKATRGLHPSGYKEVLVYNTEDLKKIDPKTQAARIAHTVGKRKRTKILVEARKKKITILNLREVKEVVEEEKELTEEKEKEEKLKEEEVEEVAETEKPKQKKKRKGRARKQ
jgi:large subunit ribosomal protein L32e